MMAPPTLTPQDFAAKWGRATLRERQAVQEHFIDLCRLIGHPMPAEDDPAGRRRCRVVDGAGEPTVPELDLLTPQAFRSMRSSRQSLPTIETG